MMCQDLLQAMMAMIATGTRFPRLEVPMCACRQMAQSEVGRILALGRASRVRAAAKLGGQFAGASEARPEVCTPPKFNNIGVLMHQLGRWKLSVRMFAAWLLKGAKPRV